MRDQVHAVISEMEPGLFQCLTGTPRHTTKRPITPLQPRSRRVKRGDGATFTARRVTVRPSLLDGRRRAERTADSRPMATRVVSLIAISGGIVLPATVTVGMATSDET